MEDLGLHVECTPDLGARLGMSQTQRGCLVLNSF